MSNTPKIDEILDTYISNYNLEVLGFQQSGQETVKGLLYQLILEVIIGENFSSWGELETEEQHDKRIENDLRAEQRLNLNNLFGKDK